MGVDDRCGIDAVGRRRGRTISGHTYNRGKEEDKMDVMIHDLLDPLWMPRATILCTLYCLYT